MENKIEKIRAKADWLLAGMKAHPNREGVWQVTVNFSGYASLYGTVQDLMKLCTVALLTEEPYVSSTVGNPNIDLANIMELAIQLLPNDVPEFLDGVQALFADEDGEQDSMPEYNYSTIRIISTTAS
ncbi:MAG: hypothetical protein ABIQ27_10225 [Flavobacterium sp.]|uniref:hypothetical protein n=1 Tax=Flavobacterium sp. TaxID=239 RepID=UPI003265D2BD